MASSKSNQKTVIITGGGSGIGLETARLLLTNKDYRVVLIGKNKGKLEDAIQSLDAPEDRVSAYDCDLASEKQINATMDKVLATHSKIYGLVNNAGVYPLASLPNTTSQQWDETFQINLKAPFLLCQKVFEKMKKNSDGGRIVNVSSTAGLLPNHFALAYSVSKAAMVSMTRTLAKELGKHNITVNCICPGIVRTPLHDEYHATTDDLENFYAKKGSTFPMGRVGEPKDVASAITYFLSEDASWVTGDVMVIDGGRLLI